VAREIATARDAGMAQSTVAGRLEDRLLQENVPSLVHDDFMTLVPAIYVFFPQHTPQEHQGLARQGCWENWGKALR
jgi:hypothetical protein